MSEHGSISRLQAALSAFGIKVYDDGSAWNASGFPVPLDIAGGQRIILDLPEPGVLANYNSEHLGIAVASNNGRIKQRWGYANKIDLLKPGTNLLDTELTNLIQGAQKEGGSGTLFLDGNRYYISAASKGSGSSSMLVLVINAEEERHLRQAANLSARSAEVFRRIGRALTMHQTLEELAVLAVHEIASAAELGAVLLWAKDFDDSKLTLRAFVGVNRAHVGPIQELEPRDRLVCAAELCASKRQVYWVHSVAENMMTAQLEAKFCYLQPGSMCVLPLMSGDRVVGILELIGREGDARFAESREMFEVIAEHLSLAINTCLTFASIEKLATYDPLTGVANHRALQDFLSGRVSESERNGSDLGVVMLDVDHFRSFNEEEGHDAGDAVLKMVAEAIKDTIRPYDLAARYGGEEFSIVMPGLDLDFTYEVAERLRKRIEQIEYASPNGRVRHVTASMGCSSYPVTAREPADLIKAADVALFKAKRAGRNRVLRYQGMLREEVLTDGEDQDWVRNWQNPDDVVAAKSLETKIKPFAEVLFNRLQLSRPQIQILENLISVYPTFKRLMALDDPEVLRKMETANEFRSLLPSLLTINERYDGNGPMHMPGTKIPLLSRVLQVLLAIAEDNGRPLILDPSKFDPEIVSIVADVQHAA